jgi:hypothetical protein
MLPLPWPMVVPMFAAVHAPRLRASGGAPTESLLAAESSTNLLTRGLLALDRASGRGAAAPASGCRVVRVALALGVPLLLRSMHGPPKLPRGSSWRSPTRLSSVALPSPCALGNWSVRLGPPLKAARCARWSCVPLWSRRRLTSASTPRTTTSRTPIATLWSTGRPSAESGSSALLPLGDVVLSLARFRLPRLRLLPPLAPL